MRGGRGSRLPRVLLYTVVVLAVATIVFAVAARGDFTSGSWNLDALVAVAATAYAAVGAPHRLEDRECDRLDLLLVRLQGMADRLDAVGGRLEVRSAPGVGTTVTGLVPARGGPVAT